MDPEVMLHFAGVAAISPLIPYSYIAHSVQGGVGADSGRLQCLLCKEDEALWLRLHMQPDQCNFLC